MVAPMSMSDTPTEVVEPPHGDRVHEVAEEVQALKVEWEKAGCTIPYMGFNLIPLSVIPEIRITDKGLVTVPAMESLALFEAA